MYTYLSDETLVLIFTMTTLSTLAQDGKASTVKKTFSRETKISAVIKADAATIWKILTSADDYTRWNSTVTALDGTIELGAKIELKSILDDKRTFKLKVKEFEPTGRLVWGDGKGKRTYLINENK